MKIASRCTYYIFCCRSKPWNNSNLPDFDLLNIYTSPFLLLIRILHFFKMFLKLFLSFGICDVLLVFEDSQLYTTLTERCMIAF